jgi:hypothetical protein
LSKALPLTTAPPRPWVFNFSLLQNSCLQTHTSRIFLLAIKAIYLQWIKSFASSPFQAVVSFALKEIRDVSQIIKNFADYIMSISPH